MAAELSRALVALGLRRVARPGERLELWPEQAGGLELDREIPEDASLVRVDVVAAGWARGQHVLARPLGRVIGVVS